MFKSLQISSTGMLAERMRLEVVSANIANANNTELDENGEPYRRKQVVMGEDNLNFYNVLNGVKVTKIQEDASDFNYKYDPSHPNAKKTGDLAGYVATPNIDFTKEMVDLLTSQRSFQLNSQCFNTSKEILNHSINIIK